MIPVIDKVVDKKVLERAVNRFKERGIILPTFAQMRDPKKIPAKVKERLKKIGLQETNPLNLFRITWKNEPVEKGGLYGGVNYIELPKTLTGVEARIVVLLGTFFPTGAHKVGAAYGCLVPRIVTGAFDPTAHKAVWPSTGNYCRGGAFDSTLMGCTAVAILPKEMSKERFDWLKKIGAEIIATPGCESNVKEIYDECNRIKATKKDHVILNQFDEFGNPAWHYAVTGPALEEVFNSLKGKHKRLAGFVSSTGSAGTIGAGDYLRTVAPRIIVAASEALQCPTLYQNGFGAHRIEGIGDKHVPWVHNVKNTDAVIAIDDEDCMRVLRLFNEPAGKKRLVAEGVAAETVEKLYLAGISGIANILGAIKLAKRFELGAEDVICTIATDSTAMYRSRLAELTGEHGKYSEIAAAKDFDRCLMGQKDDYLKELTYSDRKALHNLKYFTWVEQQGKEIEDIHALWQDNLLWHRLLTQTVRWDELIEEFNAMTGVLKSL